MAGPILIQQCSWPGVKAVASCTYAIGHGITPGRAILTTYPQTGAIAAFGQLQIGDGVRKLVLNGCRVARMTGRKDGEGTLWILEIEDRRWMWPSLAGISGTYNRLDERGKLVPWTIRSPAELAVLCLDAMGEKRYKINLPPGIKRADGKNLERYLLSGENFPQSLTNPPTVWDHTPPAEALARLADYYGCRVVYQPNLDRVIVTPTGVGRTLPAGPCEALTGGADAPRLPKAVAVAGAPVRIQARFALEAVGEEWDGRVLPINDLSYAPKARATVQITTCTYTGGGSPDLSVYITLRPGADDEDSILFRRSGPSGTVPEKLTGIANEINFHTGAKEVIKASASGKVLTLTGLNGQEAFGVGVDSNEVAQPDSWTSELVQPAGPAGERSWRTCPPPLFPTVQATDRLSYGEAVAKAQKSVFKWYRIVNLDVFDGKAPIKLPWVGPIKRLQQIILEETKVAQVVPEPRIPGAQDRNNPIRGALPPVFLMPGVGGIDVIGNGVLPWFYDGYSRDQPATVTGSVYKGVSGQPLWTGEDFNTPQNSRVFVDFAIDPYWQVVKFSDFVWKHPGVANGSAFVGVPSLTLETACKVTHHETGAFLRWEEVLPLGGLAPVEWSLREDVQVGVIGLYEDSALKKPESQSKTKKNKKKNKGVGFRFQFLDDAKGRAGYYLRGMAARYQLPTADTRQYIGIYPIDPDGLVQQVTYTISGAGPTTVASLNTEHAVAIPPYPERRLKENLAPNRQAALANLIERRLSGIPGAP